MAAPVISGQTLSDYSITLGENTIASLNATNMTSNDFCFFTINEKIFLMITEDDAAYTYSLDGIEVGACSTQTVSFFAVNTSGTVIATADAGSTLTVTDAGVYPHDTIVNFLRSQLTDYNTTRAGEGTNWIYPDRPRTEDLSPLSYPRIGVKILQNESEPLGMQSTEDYDKIRMQIDVFTSKDSVHTSMGGEKLALKICWDIKSALRSNWRTDINPTLWNYKIIDGPRNLGFEKDTGLYHYIIVIYFEGTNMGE